MVGPIADACRRIDRWLIWTSGAHSGARRGGIAAVEPHDSMGSHLPGARRELAGPLPLRVARSAAAPPAPRARLPPAGVGVARRPGLARDRGDRHPGDLGPPAAPRARARTRPRRSLARPAGGASGGAVDAGSRRTSPPSSPLRLRAVRRGPAERRDAVALPRARPERPRS